MCVTLAPFYCNSQHIGIPIFYCLSLKCFLTDLQDAVIGYPTLPENNVFSKSVRIFPCECRERAVSYKAKISVKLKWRIDHVIAGSITKVAGQVPIMVKVSLYVLIGRGGPLQHCTNY